jgi:hypothetical protein
MSTPLSRRDFSKGAVTTTAAAAMPVVARAGRVIGANDRVRIGCIGVGYRGVQVLFAFGAHKDAETASLCTTTVENLVFRASFFTQPP